MGELRAATTDAEPDQQEIRLTAVSLPDRHPLEGAVVIVTSNPTRATQEAVTDPRGAAVFRPSVPGSTTVRILFGKADCLVTTDLEPGTRTTLEVEVRNCGFHCGGTIRVEATPVPAEGTRP